MTFESIKQIPVKAGPDGNVVGSAEIKQDGSIMISIEPGMLERNKAILVPEQIHVFYVHYNYTLPDPHKPLPMRQIGEERE